MAAKENLGWPLEPWFFVPESVKEHFQETLSMGENVETKWEKKLEKYKQKYPVLGNELSRRLRGELPEDWDTNLPQFPADDKGLATRASSGKVLNTLASNVPELIGGSADLAPSNKTWIDGETDFQSDTPSGRNFHFGVREHAMGAIINGMAVHGGVIPYGGTFLVFSDYMRPAIRLSALAGYPSIWVFTHDSIGLGEDGPTHQPVEHLAALRAIPDLVLIRPCDANEVVEAWKIAITRRNGPTALIFTRQSVPTLDRSIYSPASELKKGAYVLADFGEQTPELILMATGSEVDLIIKAASILSADSINVRVVSFPSWELFARQDQNYRDNVLLPDVKARLAVEAGVSQGWFRWVGDYGAVITVEKFGASAPYKVLYKEYGLTIENIVLTARKLIQ
jgi:transketolase